MVSIRLSRTSSKKKKKKTGKKLTVLHFHQDETHAQIHLDVQTPLTLQSTLDHNVTQLHPCESLNKAPKYNSFGGGKNQY